ncbi:MAG: OprD family porin [Desulfarculaceae bacterium]|nr:OprD family porin [Desulfarculaceae bacterium]MCF8072144.1 OprD family porin [Desulfarculaceae bacterium]MCF8100065.1 OprD family porin [Desulfarculaceae bacterium]MCF8118272.1 OprD family porin [Desulfarculaceae bacterium]
MATAPDRTGAPDIPHLSQAKLSMSRKIICCLLVMAVVLLAPAAGDASQDGLWSSLGQGDLRIKLRNFFMYRDYNDKPDEAAWAMGGEFFYATKPWHGLSIGGSLYTSQPFFYAPASRAGTDLLSNDQTGYTVLGQAYLKASAKGFSLTAGRQLIDNPLLNPFDFRMTPVTFEALSLEYAQGGLSLNLAQVVGYKSWNDTTFQPMSQAPGLGGGDEAVTMGGVSYQWGSYRVQLWDYFCHQFMNSLYVQADGAWELAKQWRLEAGLQVMGQQDVGQAKAGTFRALQSGLKGALTWRRTTLTLAYTDTADGHDMVNPWSAWPGYTAIMELSNDQAGQRTWLFRLGAELAQYGAPGLEATLTHTRATVPAGRNFAKPDQLETDLDLKYFFQGPLKPLWIRLKAAYVDQDVTMGGDTFTDIRFIVNYDFSL